MSKSASTSALETLHNTLAEKLAELLEGVDGETKGGAALLNVARQFLKDNNIEATPAQGTPLRRIADRVAQFPYDPESDSFAPH